jgi:uncharacterized protein YutE (UPF0331/DUF86 family)
MVERDVVLAKVATIDRCLRRIADVREARKGDITVLNLQRATQATIDLAAHVVSTEGFGLPDSLGATFTLLEQRGLVDAELAIKLRKMVGFRNIAVHDYQTVDPAVVEAIVTGHLDDLRTFAARILTVFGIHPT